MRVKISKIPVVQRSIVRSCFPKRENRTHKGNYGKILLLCGSKGCCGAAVMAAAAAVRCGSGLVYLAVPECIYSSAAASLLEPVILPQPEEKGCISAAAIDNLGKLLPKMDAVLIGPGFGKEEGCRKVFAYIMEHAEVPVVVDADAITLLSESPALLQSRSHPTVLTPHDGEFARLQPASGIDRIMESASFAEKNHCILVRKGYHSMVFDGKTAKVNLTGNPGMAKGGSGDVLSGIMVSLLGRRIDPFTAAQSAVWLHGYSGDLCAEVFGEYGMTPGDMISMLPEAIMKLTE